MKPKQFLLTSSVIAAGVFATSAFAADRVPQAPAPEVERVETLPQTPASPAPVEVQIEALPDCTRVSGNTKGPPPARECRSENEQVKPPVEN